MCLPLPRGNRWTLKQFQRAHVVSIPAGYRRCAHEHGGFRCEQTYVGGRGTHMHCARHRAN